MKVEWIDEEQFGMTARIYLDDSTYLFLHVEKGYASECQSYWTWDVSAWTVLPDEEVDDCWFTTDVICDPYRCATLEEAMKGAEDFVENFQKALDREVASFHEWLHERLAAIERLRGLLASKKIP